MKLNFEGLEMRRWNIPTDKAQEVDDKNGVIFYLSCLLPLSRSVSEIAYFLHFLLMPAKS